jgi:hypothetical protein
MPAVLDTSGDLSSSFGGSGPDDFNGQGERNGDGSWGTKAEGKVAARGCVKF